MIVVLIVVVLVLSLSIMLITFRSNKHNMRNAQHGHKYYRVIALDLDETLIHYDIQSKRVIFRPHVFTFLKEVKKRSHEIVLFTASLQEYADPIIQHLEQISGIRFNSKLYRDSCSVKDGYIIKDLRAIPTSQKSCIAIVLVDNTPSVFALQPQNGVLIKSFTGDPNDDELKRIIPIIEQKFTTLCESEQFTQISYNLA